MMAMFSTFHSLSFKRITSAVISTAQQLPRLLERLLSSVLIALLVCLPQLMADVIPQPQGTNDSLLQALEGEVSRLVRIQLRDSVQFALRVFGHEDAGCRRVLRSFVTERLNIRR